MLAEKLGLDPWEFRRRNALAPGDSHGRPASGWARPRRCRDCLDAIRPRWIGLRAEAEAFNRTHAARAAARRRDRVHVVRHRQHQPAEPVEMVMGLQPRRTRGAVLAARVDIGQGSNTILLQIAADALGVPVEGIGR